MASSSTHPSRTSVDSVTPLGISYRPPQKNYAAAFGALQATYGTTGTPAVPRRTESSIAKDSKKASTKKPASVPNDTVGPKADSDGRTSGVKAVGRKIVKAVGLAARAVFGRASESVEAYTAYIPTVHRGLWRKKFGLVLTPEILPTSEACTSTVVGV
ncbi:hypothetical protein B0H16DRAFT_1478998 [Mycena metata]|uniref:Uncharacterized protein n=1 Tax=Mycena metata TaxID=1033252 RepID=A0AAD7H6C7_9AGAR|nr:hypothetical protein B0H16DRAFT_1478998 [Mycena metata]